MPIEPVKINLSAYEQVTICSPVWVFSLVTPVRTFCRQSAGKIKNVSYIIVHHQKKRYENAVKEMDALLGIPHKEFRSIQCKQGTYRN